MAPPQTQTPRCRPRPGREGAPAPAPAALCLVALLLVAAAAPSACAVLASQSLRHYLRGATPSAAPVDATDTMGSTQPPPTRPPPPPPPPIEVTARLHQSARLPCAVVGGGAGGGATWRQGQRALADAADAHRYALQPRSGELSLSNVRAADAGLWLCQPPPRADGSPVATRPVRLVVIEPPREPYLEVDGRRLDAGNVFLPVAEGAPLAVACAAEGGLPPPQLSWRLGGAALAAAGAEGDAEGEGGRFVRSEVRLPRVLRAHHNATVACLVRHPALPRPLNATLRLHVHYPPSFAISREPGFGFPLVEGIAVSLKCEVDANPPSAPVWLKDDGLPPVAQSADGFLNFSAIRREHSGWYKCTSGDFSSIGYFLNVRSDVSLEVTLEPGGEAGGAVASSTHRQLEVALGGAVQLQCPLEGGAGGAGGAPCWSRVGAGGALEPLAAGPQLSLERVLYQEAGAYRCAVPHANAPSSAHALQHWRSVLDVTVSVHGAPMARAWNATVLAAPGQAAALRVEFCAHPPADRALWLPPPAAPAAAAPALRPGEAYGRLVAHPLQEGGGAGHCHVALLEVLEVRAADAGEYALLVRSPRGLAEAAVALNVTHASGFALGAAPAPTPPPSRALALALGLLFALARLCDS